MGNPVLLEPVQAVFELFDIEGYWQLLGTHGPVMVMAIRMGVKLAGAQRWGLQSRAQKTVGVAYTATPTVDIS